jgi:hypothetical protein
MHPILQPSRIVLICENILPRMSWKLAIISETFPLPDEHIRVATVKTGCRQLKRSIHTLVMLPVEQSETLNFSGTRYREGSMFKFSVPCWQDCLLWLMWQMQRRKEIMFCLFIYFFVFITACYYCPGSLCVAICKLCVAVCSSLQQWWLCRTCSWWWSITIQTLN